MKWLFGNLGYKLLAAGVALLLWGVSHGTNPIERGFDVGLALQGVPENLVVTDQSADAVNIRVEGSRAALRSLSVADVEYVVDLSGARAGITRHEVDAESVERPRGAQIVSRSPASIDFTLEPRGAKAVKVREDLAGEPAEGFKVAAAKIVPPFVWITGPEREVRRLKEVVTETVDVTGINESFEREVRPLLAGSHLNLRDEDPIRIQVEVIPLESEGAEAE